MTNFDKQYWTKNYSDPQSMDGIGNATEHAKYLKSYFNVEFVDIESIIDLGFGHGYLFKEMLKTFLPYKAYGIEPSEYIFKKAKIERWKPVESTKLKIENTDLLSWCTKPHSEIYDLGICTSVFQYISTHDLKLIIPILSKRVKYLYLTVPTNLELKRQVEELNFKDEYALHRSSQTYKKLISPYFTFISSRILESKHFFNNESTLLTDLLYRF
jgi:hypothetical protein